MMGLMNGEHIVLFPVFCLVVTWGFLLSFCKDFLGISQKSQKDTSNTMMHFRENSGSDSYTSPKDNLCYGVYHIVINFQVSDHLCT